MNIECFSSTDNMIIRCGLQNDFGLFQETTSFWPVAQAIPLHPTLDAHLFSQPFSIVFSSKTAVKFFYENVFNAHKNILDHCDAIYCVGKKTNNYFEYLFSQFDVPEKICFSNGKGIHNLVYEYNLTHVPHTLLFFTAFEGKTGQFVQKTIFKSVVGIIPLYSVIPYKSDFLDQAFSETSEDGKIYTFECRSGKIFEFAAQFLMEHHKCSNISQLPKNIKFLPIGNTALEKERRLHE